MKVLLALIAICFARAATANVRLSALIGAGVAGACIDIELTEVGSGVGARQ